MILIFNRQLERLVLLREDEAMVAFCNAANNVDSRSKGIWQPGIYTGPWLERKMEEPSDSIGKYFLEFPPFVEKVGRVEQERSSMGIHAGREGKTDMAGRADYRYATMGCIRTTAAAMEIIAAEWTKDPVTHLWIRN